MENLNFKNISLEQKVLPNFFHVYTSTDDKSDEKS